MKCQEAMDLLEQSASGAASEEHANAAAHAARCDDCRAALDALSILRADRVASPPPGAFERAMAIATSGPLGSTRTPRSFWSGLGVGAALAAGVAFAIVMLTPIDERPGAIATPQIVLALNETRDVSVSLTSAEALPDAEIHVVLSGAIGLIGFEGEKELRWRTNLEPGTNQLTLPIVALGPSGGQLLVEVVHGEKRRTFLVDIVGVG